MSSLPLVDAKLSNRFCSCLVIIAAAVVVVVVVVVAVQFIIMARNDDGVDLRVRVRYVVRGVVVVVF
jgi:hypothetical protein